MRVLVVGGHHSSSLEVAKLLKERGAKVLWVGHVHSLAGDSSVSAEYTEVRKARIEFEELVTGKYHRQSKLMFGLKLAGGFWTSRRIVAGFHPEVIYTAGGYLSPPLVWAGKLAGAKIVIHEHTRTEGKANRQTARWADVILTAWPQVNYDYPADKTRCVGLPLRPGLIKLAKNGKRPPHKKQPELLVLGGKQGSRIMNRTVFAALPRLTKEYRIFHQTGAAAGQADYKKALKLTSKYEGYRPAVYFFPDEMRQRYRQASVVVSRAGAHSTYELAVLRLPCVLVPIPWAANNEQRLNAEFVAGRGRGVIVQQAGLTPAELVAAVRRARQRRSVSVPNLPLDATEKTVSAIENVLK